MASLWPVSVWPHRVRLEVHTHTPWKCKTTARVFSRKVAEGQGFGFSEGAKH